MLDLKVVEDLLISNPMIARMLIFLEHHKVFKCQIRGAKAYSRIINNNEEFYIDNFGYKVPLSKKYSARVPIFYGEIDNNLNI